MGGGMIHLNDWTIASLDPALKEIYSLHLLPFHHAITALLCNLKVQASLAQYVLQVSRSSIKGRN